MIRSCLTATYEQISIISSEKKNKNTNLYRFNSEDMASRQEGVVSFYVQKKCVQKK